MLEVSALYIYPIKSLGGIELKTAKVTDRGLEHDRRWMLVDSSGKFMSQRELPQMALLQVHLEANGLRVQHKHTGAALLVPYTPQTDEQVTVAVWDSRSKATRVSTEADAWFAQQLGMRCTLAYMPDELPIAVDPEYARAHSITSFSDGYPFLLIGQSSLNDLNSRLNEPVPMNRFRPNIVVSGASPFAEDGWHQFLIGGLQFFGVKRCARCVVTTIDQEAGVAGKEPLKTLAGYRREGNKIFFGQNLLHEGTGSIAVGDLVTVPADFSAAGPK